jgi:hypothetical protein
MNPNKLERKCLSCHKMYIKCLATSYISSVINVKINVLIQDISKLIVKSTENAIYIVCVLPYLCKQLYSAPVESGLIGRRKYWLVVELVCGVRGVLEEFKHGVVFIRMLFGNEFIITTVKSVIVSLIFPYSCLQLSKCSAQAERGSLFFIYRTCSRNLRFRLRGI